MKRIVFVLVLGLFILGPVAQAAAVEIFYPADRTYVTHADYLIIKGGNPQLEAMVLAFNGLRSAPINVGDPNYRKAFGDMLIIPSPPFEKGQNEIVVEGYVAGKLMRSSQATIYYQPDYTVAPPESFVRFVMHIPEREAGCAGCHTMQVDEAQMSISDPAQNPCLSCHKAMVKGKYVHGPVGSFSCGDCHLIAETGEKYPVAMHGAGLCNECHDDKAEEFKRNAFVHGPVAAGMCEACHDPHGSANPRQLIERVNVLCLGCHVDIEKSSHVVRGVGGASHPLEGAKNPRNPKEPFSCVSCHDPHGGTGKTFLIEGQTQAFGVCTYCHEK
ncbi:MAG: cytochrome C [Desulfuromonas sp.]|nr:MAG: cytochrome C [Desulfuromonas sp.]